MEIIFLWLQFVIGAALIIFAGVKLTVYADIFSEKLNIGKAFIGMIFLGLVTSLPEMVMSITALLQPAPSLKIIEQLGIGAYPVNLAIGNITGSILFNVFALAFMEMVIRKGPMSAKLDARETLSPLLAIMMSVVVIIALIFGNNAARSCQDANPLIDFLNNPGGINISFFTFIIFGMYIFATYFLYKHDQKGTLKKSAITQPEQYGELSLGATTTKAFIAILVVVGAGIWVAGTADTLAEVHGLSKSFVGTVFLALVSSLPEFTTTISAGRMGNFSMAVGNIFGSNIFNVMTLGLADIFYRRGAIFALEYIETPKHEVMTCLGILISTIFLVGFIYGSKRSPFKASWTAIIITLLYIVGLIVYYFI